MKHFKTAYLKLTLFYVAIVMVISIAFSWILFGMSSNELERGLGRQTRVLRDISFGQLSRQPIPDFEQLRLDQLDESSNHLRLNLIYFNLLILLISTGLSYFLAKKTLEPIEEAMDAQNRFTADASHELRTPLTAMRTEIEVNLRDKSLKLPEAKSLLRSNLEEIEKLESLSSALLKLARYQENESPSFEKISLEDMLVEAYEKVESIAGKKSIEFENNLRDLTVMGDHQSLVELFVILFDNAIKYSPNGSKISIDVVKEKDHAIIRVKDQGIGIKASDLPYIFNRFFRSDISRTKEKVSGYGLGLSIAKRIVELHKGDIAVTSKPDKGSEFSIKLKIVALQDKKQSIIRT